MKHKLGTAQANVLLTKDRALSDDVVMLPRTSSESGLFPIGKGDRGQWRSCEVRFNATSNSPHTVS